MSTLEEDLKKFEENINQMIEDVKAGKMTFEEAKRIALADMKNNIEKLKKELELK